MSLIGFSAGSIEATLTLDRSPFQRGLDEAKAEADAFAHNRYAVTLDADGGKARRDIDETRVLAERYGALRPTVQLQADTAKATTAITGALAVAKAAEKDAIRIKLDADKVALDRKLADAQAQLARVREHGADIVLDAQIGPFMDKAAKLQAQVDKWKTQRSTVQVDANIAKADAEIARLYEHIQLISERDLSVEVRALTEDAEAKLARLNLQAAQLDRKRIELTVDAAGTQAAAEGMSQVAKYAYIAAAALPLVGAAVVALPGLLAAAVVPAAAVALGIDGIKASAQSLQAPFIELKGAVSDAFERGLEPAIRNVAGLLPTLEGGLVGAASSLSGLATNVTAVVTSSTGLSDVFAGVNSLIDGLSPGISGLTSNLIGLARQGIAGLQPLGAVFTQLSTEWQQVIDTLARTGQGRAAVDALVQVLGGLLGLLPPLVQLGASLMAAIGPPLAAALQATAAVLTPIANLFTALPGPVQTAAAALIAFRVASSLLGSSGTEAAAATRAVGTAAESAARGVASAEQSTSRLGQAFNTAMTPVRAVRGVFADMGTSFRTATANLDEGAGKLTRFGAAAGGVASAGVTGLKAAGTGLFSLLGGPWGLAIAGATIGLGLLGDHMQQSAEKAQQLAQASQSFADSMSRTGGVVTSATTQLVAHAAVQNGLVQSTDQLGISSQTVTTAITQQGPALDGLRAQLQGVIDSGTTYGQTMDGDVTITTSDAAKAAQDALGKLNDLAGAFQSGQVAARALGDAMGTAAAHFGEEAAQADAATRTTALFAQAMTDVGDNTKSASDKVKGFSAAFQSASDAPLTFLDAQLKANEALTKFAEAADKIPPAVVGVSGAIDTTTKAGQQLATQISSAAKSYEDLYGATLQNAQAQGVAMPQAIAQAAAASSGYRERLIEQATQHGLTRSAAEAMANQYLAIPKDVTTQIQQPGMVEAVAQAIGLKGHIDEIPGGKSIIVDAPQTPAVLAQLKALGLQVTTLPNGKVAISAEDGATPVLTGLVQQIGAIRPVNIPVGADAAQAHAALDQVMGAINAASGMVNINGNNVPAGTALQQVLAAINAGQASVLINGQTVPAEQALGQIIAAINAGNGTVTINGQTVPASTALQQLLGQVNGSTGTITIDGNKDPATGKITQTVTLANGSKGTITVDGNPDPATGKIRGTVTLANGSKGTITIDGNQTPANGKINATVTYADGRTGTIKVNANTAAAEAAIARAAQDRTMTITAIVRQRALPPGHTAAGGAVFGFAGGGYMQASRAQGMVIPGYAPGIDTVPTLMSKGESVLVPELTRMLGAGRILAANAQASGGRPATVVGQIASMMDGTIGATVNLGPLSGRGGTATTTHSGSSADIVAAIQDLRRDVQQLQKAKGDVTINAPTYNPAAQTSAESQARALRTGAALIGMLPR